MGIFDRFRPPHKHSDPNVRSAALAKMMNQDTYLIREIARDDPELSVRLSAWDRLENLAEDRGGKKWEVCQQRAKALVQDLACGDPDVRLKIVEAFGSLGIRATYDPVNALQTLNDNDERVRHACHESILKILISALMDTDTCPSILGCHRAQIKVAAAKGFQVIIDPRAVDALLFAVTQDEVGYVRQEAILALAKQHDSRAAMALASMLNKQKFSQDEGFVAEALRKIGDPKGIEVGIEYKVLHRDEAVNALVGEAVKALLASECVIEFDDLGMRGMSDILKFDGLMSEILEREDGLDAIPVLLTQLGRWDYSHDRHLVEYLAGLGQAAVPYLCVFLDRDMDGYTDVKIIVARALGRIRDGRAINSLRKLTASYNSNIRDAAKEAVKAIQEAAQSG